MCNYTVKEWVPGKVNQFLLVRLTNAIITNDILNALSIARIN